MKKYIIILFSMLLLAGGITNAQTIKRQKPKIEQTQKSSSNTPKSSSPKTSQSKKNTSKKSSKTATKSTKVDNQKSEASSASNQKINEVSNYSGSDQKAFDEQKETETAFGWHDNIKDSVENVVENTQNSGEQIFRVVEYMPHFPGGESALMEYLKKNIRYPVGAALRGVEGRVVVQFVVTATGDVADIKVVRSIDEELDNEAVRVCRHLPRFEPGRLENGDPVNVWYALPVRFTLPEHDRPHND